MQETSREISCQKVTVTIFLGQVDAESTISFVILYFGSLNEQILDFADVDNAKRINSARRRKNRMNKKCTGSLGGLRGRNRVSIVEYRCGVSRVKGLLRVSRKEDEEWSRSVIDTMQDSRKLCQEYLNPNFDLGIDVKVYRSQQFSIWIHRIIYSIK